MARKAKERRRRFGWTFKRKSAHGVTTWYAQWLDPESGRRLTRSIGEKESDAGDFLDAIEARLRLGTYSAPPTAAQVDVQPERPEPVSVPTFVAYSASQLAGRLSVKSASTLRYYGANHRALAAFFGERKIETGSDTRTVPAKRLDEFKVTDAIEFRVWRKSVRFAARRRERVLVTPTTDADGKMIPVKPVSTSAVNRDVQYLSMVFGFAIADGLVSANPFAGLRHEREERRVRRYLAKSEVTRLILACDQWLRSLVVAALFTGARGGELKLLKWGDVDFEGSKITLYRPKVRSADRIDLHPVLADELRRVHAATLAAKTKNPKRPGVQPNESVFLNRWGEPYQDVRKSWARAIKSAGLAGRAGLTFHALRHTFATHFLSNGGAVSDLQAQLGHSKMETTQIYASMINERRRDTVLALDYGALTARATDSQKAEPSSGGAAVATS